MFLSVSRVTCPSRPWQNYNYTSAHHDTSQTWSYPDSLFYSLHSLLHHPSLHIIHSQSYLTPYNTTYLPTSHTLPYPTPTYTPTMPNYTVTEPSPSTTTYVRSGRGGYGNVVRAPTSQHISNVQSVSSVNLPSRRFFSGIGGAGNVHQASERPVISLDEEYSRIAARDQASAGHCGIGGAGNVYRRKASDASSQASDASSMSSKSKLWARVSSTFSRD